VQNATGEKRFNILVLDFRRVWFMRRRKHISNLISSFIALFLKLLVFS